jgi:hypothetical protein
VIRPAATAPRAVPGASLLGILVAVLVCIGLLAHVTPIDSDTTGTAAAASGNAVPATAVSAVTLAVSGGAGELVALPDRMLDASPTEPHGSLGLLCGVLGVLCALAFVVFQRVLRPYRTDRGVLSPAASPQPALSLRGDPLRGRRTSTLTTPLRL